MELSKSNIVFDQQAHTYTTPDGRRLQGITGMLERQLFPKKYEGVPEHVMETARQRGSFVHEVCELVDTLVIAHESPEANAYRFLKDTYSLHHEASEYLVSDNERFASCIDKVYRDGEDSFALADIKTTYKLDKEYVRWQLSVYAYLFELQNPGAAVSRLMAIWLRGEQAELAEVERIPSGIIIALLEAEAEGRQFAGSLAVPSSDISLPDKYRQMEQSIIEIDRQARYWAEQKKTLMDGIMREMVLAGAYQWEGDSVKFTRKKDGIRKSFDQKRLEKDHPDIYAAYLTETSVAGSVTLKTK